MNNQNLNLVPFFQIIYSETEGRIHLIESMQFTRLAMEDKTGVLMSMADLFKRKIESFEAVKEENDQV